VPKKEDAAPGILPGWRPCKPGTSRGWRFQHAWVVSEVGEGRCVGTAGSEDIDAGGGSEVSEDAVEASGVAEGSDAGGPGDVAAWSTGMYSATTAHPDQQPRRGPQEGQ